MSVVKVNDTYFNINAVSVIGPILELQEINKNTPSKTVYAFNVIVTGFRIDLKFDSKDVADISRDHFVGKWKSSLDIYQMPVAAPEAPLTPDGARTDPPFPNPPRPGVPADTLTVIVPAMPVSAR